MFYLRNSCLRHMQDNFGSARVGSGSDWESSRFHITDLNMTLTELGIYLT